MLDDLASSPLRSPQDIGAAIRNARRARQWHQRDLARTTGLSQPQISDLERGTGNARIGTLLAVFAALDLDLTFISRQRPAFNPEDY